MPIVQSASAADLEAGERAFSVVVPGSSANIGPGFDCFAIALSTVLKVSVRIGRLTEGSEPVTISCMGPIHLPPSIPLSSENFIYKVAQAASRSLSGEDLLASGEALHLAIHNAIPIGKGMGSSGAAVVAGIMIAGGAKGVALTKDKIFEMALAFENHPDNLAATIYGSFAMVVQQSPSLGHRMSAVPFVRTIAWPERDLSLIMWVAPYELSTERARQVLPASYSQQDAVGEVLAPFLRTCQCSSSAHLLTHPPEDRCSTRRAQQC